jgi:succinate-acetate transporter protein
MSTPAARPAGTISLMRALLAFYASSALVKNAVYGRTVLPLFGKA